MILYKYMSEDNFKKYWRFYLDGFFHFAKWEEFNDPMEGFFSFVANNNNERMAAWDITSHKQLFTVLCMAEESSNILMWSHYASNHTGVCLEVEVDTAILSNSAIELHKVRYPNRIPELNLRISARQQAKKILTRKLRPWAYEKEHRLLADTKIPGLHKVGNVKKVIIGKRFEFKLTDDLSLRADVINDCNNKDISVHIADFNFTTYTMSHSRTSRFK